MRWNQFVIFWTASWSQPLNFWWPCSPQTCFYETCAPSFTGILLEGIHLIPETAGQDLAPGAPCPFLAREIWVAADGRLNPCCAPDEKRQTLGYFGNLTENSLKEILHGEPYQALLSTYDTRTLCQGCNMRRWPKAKKWKPVALIRLHKIQFSRKQSQIADSKEFLHRRFMTCPPKGQEFVFVRVGLTTAWPLELLPSYPAVSPWNIILLICSIGRYLDIFVDVSAVAKLCK